MKQKLDVRQLQKFAIQIRIETIRQIAARGFGHVGGSMSIADTLAVLYGHAMKVDPQNPKWEERDWFICSKGHAGPAVYATLALKGFFPMEWLPTLNVTGTNLPSHCDRNRTPGVDMTTGSLGQGISMAVGVALGHKLDGKSNTVYCMVGDGECQEGQVWEAILFAAQQKLSNFVLFVDDNHVQLDGETAEVNNLESFDEKLRAFHFRTIRIDGHNVAEIAAAIEEAKTEQEQPSAIILDTVKGKSCTFAEDTFNHHITVSADQAADAIAALEAELAVLA